MSRGPARRAWSSPTSCAPGGRLFLFDTGIGAGHPELDARYHPVERHLADALAGLGHGLEEVRAVTNCHLHADHAGQNHRLPGIPIYVQSAERAAASRSGYTVSEWVDGPGLRYEPIDGDRDVLPGVRILASPGHTAGHQSLLVATRRGPGLPFSLPLKASTLPAEGKGTARAA